jgi:lipase
VNLHAVTRGQGAPVLLLHCSLASHRALLPLAHLLPGRQTLADLPGHGASPDWDGVTDYTTVCAQSAVALCDGPTHLIGHSFGATVALRLACDRPDLVARLTLIEPVFFAAARGTPEWDAHQTAFVPFIAAMQAGDHRAATQVFHGLWGAGPWDALPPTVQQSLIRRVPLIPAGAPAIEQDNAGLLNGLLDRVKVPVTLIRGDRSPAIIAAIHRGLQAHLPQATDHVVPDAGHMVPLTHPHQVAVIIAGS